MDDELQYIDGNMDGISSARFRIITGQLQSLAGKLGVTGLILADSSGRVLARETGKDWQGDTVACAALTAGSFAAAKELAVMLGESHHFKTVLLEGEKVNILICSVTKDIYLVTVFKTGVALGMARLLVRQTVSRLRQVLRQPETGDEQVSGVMNSRFQALLDDELDRSFNDT